jgi:N-acetylmuramoyl-L-alanine amidase
MGILPRGPDVDVGDRGCEFLRPSHTVGSAALCALLATVAVFMQAGFALAASRYARSDNRAVTMMDPGACRVSGRVASATGCGAPGTLVHVALSGSEDATTLTDASGNYSINLTEHATYTVSCTPSGTTGCTFTPVAATAVLTTTDHASIDFSAKGLHAVSGHIPTRQMVSPKGIRVTCRPWGSSAITDAAGNYSIVDVPDGAFAVIAARNGLRFTPANKLVTVNGSSIGGVGFDAMSLLTVVIDAGHQAKADVRTEPIGPGSKRRTFRVAGGTRGVATHRPESLVNLQVALRLRGELAKRGVTVVMVRTRQSVDIANSARAKIANRAHAALFVRLHCNGCGSSAVKGVLTIVPAKNRWTSRIVRKSARAGRDIQRATLRRTHARNRGTARRGDLSGFNWSKVPSALVEMGFMSNPAEDRKLASSAYQGRLAVGIADGIVRYLKGK